MNLFDCIYCSNVTDGWAKRPVNRSVTAKQESRMFVLLCRLGRFLTAMMTNTFSKTVKGQAILLRIGMVPTVKLKSRGWTHPPVSFTMVAFCKILFVLFVKLKLGRNAMSFHEWNPCAGNCPLICLLYGGQINQWLIMRFSVLISFDSHSLQFDPVLVPSTFSSTFGFLVKKGYSCIN